MEQDPKDGGRAVHKEPSAVASADGRGGEPRTVGTLRNQPEAVARRVRPVGPAQQLVGGDEAGPCGSGWQRQLTARGAACQVIAPALVPTRPGDRGKRDRREALKLARLRRSGERTAGGVPEAAHAA
jgi:transposase